MYIQNSPVDCQQSLSFCLCVSSLSNMLIEVIGFISNNSVKSAYIFLGFFWYFIYEKSIKCLFCHYWTYSFGVFQIFMNTFVFENKNETVNQAENIWRKERKEKEKWVLHCRGNGVNLKELVQDRYQYLYSEKAKYTLTWYQRNEKCLGK